MTEDIQRLSNGDRVMAFVRERPVGIAGFNRNDVAHATALKSALSVLRPKRAAGVSLTS